MIAAIAAAVSAASTLRLGSWLKVFRLASQPLPMAPVRS